MVDDSDDKVGYKRPPKKSRWKRGESGNPRGRPRKEERSFTERQGRTDVLVLGAKPTTIRTKDGEQQVTLALAVLMRLAAKALEGNGPAAWRFLKIHREAVRDHEQLHAAAFKPLEDLERHLMAHPEEMVLARKTLAKLRRQTRGR